MALNNRKIIAIVGLTGSGKTEVISYLEEKLKCPKIYFGEPTFDEIKRLGLEINEKNERMIREGLRKKFGPLYYAKEVIKKVENVSKTNKKAKVILLESLYMWDEYLLFKEKFKENFYTIAVSTSPKTRYQRLTKRKHRPLTPKESQSRDYSQIENLKQAGPIAMADYTIINEGSKKDLINQTVKIAKKITNKNS